MKGPLTIAFLLFAFYSCTLYAQEEKPPSPFTLHGYVKDLQGVQVLPGPDSLYSLNLLHNRLNIGIRFNDNFSGRIEIRNRLYWGDMLKQVPDFGRQVNEYNGLADLSRLWVNRKSLVAHTVVDRALLQYANADWDIRIGRQRINWGVSNAWNPNDIFNAYNFLDFDYEERPGNDAIRIQHSGKGNRSWELAYKPSRERKGHIAGILYKFNRRSYDFQFLGGLWQEDLVAGAGWAGRIREAGFKGELSYFHPQKEFADSTGTVSLTLMADQSFKKDWYLSFSALFNSNPGLTNGGTSAMLASPLTAKNLFPYRYSFLATTIKSFSPVCSMTVSVVYSPRRHSLILFPSWSWNLATNADLDIIAQSFFSREGGRYKMQGTSIYVRGKWSF